MNWVMKQLRSSIGAKVVMAKTGLLLTLFVLVHMLGNLQVFQGPEGINAYAAFLKSKPGLLWTARIGLLVIIALHVWSGIRLNLLNAAARPIPYAKRTWRRASLTSRTMVWSGIFVFAFVGYHLAHFTLGLTNPDDFHRLDALGQHDVYSMMVLGFQNPLISALYIIGMLALGFHLSHGVSSMFQSLGLKHPRYNPLIEKIGPVYAAIIVIGNISMPIAVLTGWIGLV